MNRTTKGKEVLDASINNRAKESSSSEVFYVKYGECYGEKLNLEDIKKMVALDIIIYSNFKFKNTLINEIEELTKMNYSELDKKRMELVAQNTKYTRQQYELVDYKLYDKKLFISYRKNTSTCSTEDCMTIPNANNKNTKDLITQLLEEIESKIQELQESTDKKNTKSLKQYSVKKTLFKQILEKENI